MQLSRKQNTFSEFFSAFSEPRFNFENSLKKKKMKLIANLFLNLRTPKNVVRYISKKSGFRGAFDK